MNLHAHWPEIRDMVLRGQRSKVHCAIASVDAEGRPNVTPVGTVFLHADRPGGYYFDQYTRSLARNVDARSVVCLMAVNAGRCFWLRSLAAGRFASLPGVRLDGTAGPLRPATPDELAAVRARVRWAQWFKGGRLLWSHFTHVRDLSFTACRPVAYPVMMDGQWETMPPATTLPHTGP